MQNLTPTVEVTGRWVQDVDIPASEATLLKLIADAEDTIETEIPGIGAKVAQNDQQYPQARFYKIVARIVLRQLRNVEGLRTVQESTGAFGGSVTYGGDEPGEMYVTARDLAELRGKNRRTAKAFTAPTVRW